MFVPYAVSWNITSRCNLNCRHCYIDANGRQSGGPGEISTAKAFEIASQIAGLNAGAVLILTGGEPLMRGDIYQIIEHSAKLGMMVVLGTNGTLLTPETASKLKDAGLSGVGVSIDSLDGQTHDSFRGLPGSLKDSIAGLQAAKEAGLNVQIQTTPTSANLGEIPAIAKWAHNFGARVFNIFFLVCTGRGETMADISPDEYEKILKWAAENRESFPGMMVRPKCAPHFKRILHQENPENHLLKTYIAACRAGTQYCRIDPEGKVTPCPYMETEAGDLTKDDFKTVWENSKVLNRYRQPEYEGKCGLCRYRLICGGCRARALATVNDDMGEDQWCVYEPVGQEEAIENVDTMSKFGAGSESDAKWAEDAEEKLLKIPFFARSIVRLAVEKYARENDIDEITAEVMKEAAPDRPPMFGTAEKQVSENKRESSKGGEIPWDDDAKARVADAPEFVRPGIWKLMQKRAAKRGKSRIDSKFLTETRDESMMLVTRRMKEMGFEGLDMSAWDTAKDKFGEDAHKVNVIDQIKSALDSRPEANKAILEKFGSFFADNVGEKMGWTKEARARIEKAPAFARDMAAKSVEKYARKNGYKYVTEQALEEALAKSPFGAFSKPKS